MIVEEVYASDGPTGNFVEVIEAKIVDAGGNEFARVSDGGEVSKFLRSHRGGPYYLEAVKTGDVVQPSEYDTLTGELGVGCA